MSWPLTLVAAVFRRAGPASCLGRKVELALVEGTQVSRPVGRSVRELAQSLVCHEEEWVWGDALPTLAPHHL